MTQQISAPWESKRTNETRMVEDHLRKVFPGTDAYRFNSASIRVRVIDERFRGKSFEERDTMVEPLLEELPEDTQRDIINLITLYPGEAEESIRARLVDLEFKDASSSLL